MLELLLSEWTKKSWNSFVFLNYVLMKKMLKLWKYGEGKKILAFTTINQAQLEILYVVYCGICVPTCLSSDRKTTFKCFSYTAQKSIGVRDLIDIRFIQTLSIKWPEMCNMTFYEALIGS